MYVDAHLVFDEAPTLWARALQSHMLMLKLLDAFSAVLCVATRDQRPPLPHGLPAHPTFKCNSP